MSEPNKMTTLKLSDEAQNYAWNIEREEKNTRILVVVVPVFMNYEWTAHLNKLHNE